MENQKQCISPAVAEKFVWAFQLLQSVAFQNNEDKGWHDPAPTDGEAVALVHTEVSEIMEWLRAGTNTPDDKIPEFKGVEAEGADVIIRLMSWYKRKGWDLAGAVVAKLRYNASRPHRHGGKAL